LRRQLLNGSSANWQTRRPTVRPDRSGEHVEQAGRAGLAKAVIENELLNWLSSELSQVAKLATPEALN
jgi:hypothetical protein